MHAGAERYIANGFPCAEIVQDRAAGAVSMVNMAGVTDRADTAGMVDMLGMANADGKDAPWSASSVSSQKSVRYEVVLPYRESALEPYISARAMRRHAGRHMQRYSEEVTRLCAGTGLAGRSLEAVMSGAHLLGMQRLTECACHLHNHQAYWQSMRAGGGGRPCGALMEAIVRSYGTWENFVSVFRSRALNRLWTGWLWLVKDGSNVMLMHDAGMSSPVLQGKTVLLALDMWECAYFMDYGEDREAYVEAFLGYLADWQAAERRFAVC